MDLDPTLLLEPTRPYSVIQTTMRSLGWEELPPDVGTAPVLPGEPEASRWCWPGGRPLLGYRYQPLSRMRVLEAGEATPRQRENIQAALGMKTPPIDLLRSKDPRQSLLGIAALGATEALEARPLLAKLEKHPEALVRQAAAQTGAELEQRAKARDQVLLGLAWMASQALPLLSALAQGADSREVQPEDEDLPLVFASEVVETVRAGYAPIWEDPPNLGTRYTQVSAHAAPAGLLRGPNHLSWEFPGGYREIAGFLEPGRTWLCWHYHDPGGVGITYDGLVWQGKRWIWFPKPWRILDRFLMARGIL